MSTGTRAVVRVVEGDARVVAADGRHGGDGSLEAGHVGSGSAQLQVAAVPALAAFGAGEAAGAVLRVHVHVRVGRRVLQLDQVRRPQVHREAHVRRWETRVLVLAPEDTNARSKSAKDGLGGKIGNLLVREDAQVASFVNSSEMQNGMFAVY